MDRADCVVVMGVAGSGKTTVGQALARRLGREFLDADRLHSQASVAKMQQGIPLTDDDRSDWLVRVRDWIRPRLEAHEDTVVACSALRRHYRDQLRTAGEGVRFCALQLPEPELAARLRRRTGHFLPASLLPSQLATLEPLQPDEPGGTIDGTGDRDAVTARALDTLGLDPA